MQSPRYVAKYGAIRFLSCPGRAAIVSKFRAVSGTACKMPSPTPPKSAKVELRDHVRSHFPEASWYVTVGVEFMAFMIVYIFTVFVLSRLGSIPVNRRTEGANTQADEQS